MKIIKSFFKYILLYYFKLDIIKRPINDTDYRNQRYFLALLHMRLPVETFQQEEELKFINFCRVNASISFSQNFQDLFVLYTLNYKKHGFFIEFGATNGIEISNTFLLESKYMWDGILAEPAITFYNDLTKNRTAKIDNRCVWTTSRELISFTEILGTGLSGIRSKLSLKGNENFIKKNYNVETISLNDLLVFHEAPLEIDFLSIDTEGSEFQILYTLNFNLYKIKIIIVEHNYKPIRDDIFQLLINNGYERKFKNLSFQDDWYVLK